MSSAGSIQMIFLSMLTCKIGSQGGPNKMAAANFLWLHFLNNRSSIQSFFWDQWFRLPTRLSEFAQQRRQLQWKRHLKINTWQMMIFCDYCFVLASFIREFTQPRRQRQQERHKFAYLTVKNNRFARFARAFFIFGHSADVLVLSTTWNDLFCSCEDDVSTWWRNVQFCLLISEALIPI